MSVPRHRDNPVILKLETTNFKSIFTPELLELVRLFNKYNYELRIAGGAVRDLLMDLAPKDVDFATTATPDEMKIMFTDENVRMINTKGEKHGTITPRINDRENFEITTLRIDVLTDGRHADVKYTKDWLLDANRRDLTINSMFLGLDGTVYDYFFGFEDLKNRRVAFVGDPDTRIKEDYLRILRYFRFYGRIAENPNSHESHTLEVIKSNLNGLEQISGERIWTELKKTLEGNFAADLMSTMLKLGFARFIGLPENPNMNEFNSVCQNATESRQQLAAISIMASLLFNNDDVISMHERLKFSAYERDLAHFIVLNRCDNFFQADNPLMSYQQLILESSQIKKTFEWTLELLKYRGDVKLHEQLSNWIIPTFPINGSIVLANIPPKNNKLTGQILKNLRLYWLRHDFKVSKEELEKMIPQVFERILAGKK